MKNIKLLIMATAIVSLSNFDALSTDNQDDRSNMSFPSQTSYRGLSPIEIEEAREYINNRPQLTDKYEMYTEMYANELMHVKKYKPWLHQLTFLEKFFQSGTFLSLAGSIASETETLRLNKNPKYKLILLVGALGFYTLESIVKYEVNRLSNWSKINDNLRHFVTEETESYHRSKNYNNNTLHAMHNLFNDTFLNKYSQSNIMNKEKMEKLE